MPSLEERSKALEMLRAYDKPDGTMDRDQVLAEIYIHSVSTENRLDAGVRRFNTQDVVARQMKKAIDRCPVIRGDITYEDAHKVTHAPAPAPEHEHDDDDVVMPSRTFMTVIVIVALLASGGAAAAWLTGVIP